MPSKIESLQLAGKVAVELRRAPKAGRGRLIKTVGPDGQVVRTISQVELVEKQLLRQGIEIDTKVTPGGARPRALRCECGMPYIVAPKGRIPERCVKCDNDRRFCTKVIDGVRCCNPLSRATWSPGRIKARNGEGAICRHCLDSHEQRSEAARKMHAAKTPEQRSEAGRKRQAAKTPEQRSEIARKRQAAKTPEQRRELAMRGVAARRAKKAAAAQPPSPGPSNLLATSEG